MNRYFIRDDDTSFFTNANDLEKVYGDIWGFGPINLAIIPFAVKTLNLGKKNQWQDPNKEYFIGDNIELVRFLKDKISENKVSIMLHGFNHYYQPSSNSNFPYGVPEFIHRKNQHDIIKKGKEILEDLFSISVKWFIPPSNAVTIETIRACDKLELNLPLLYDLKNRFWNTLLVSPTTFFINRANKINNFNRPLKFKRHIEVLCTSYTSVTDFNSSYVDKKRNMVIATHYWELIEYPNIRKRILEDLNFYGNQIFSLNDL